MDSVRLHWMKCTDDKWCLFANLNLEKVGEHGVYMVWHGGDAPHVVYVGKGDVADRISRHRNNQKITRHAAKGSLFVTWASVPAPQRDGVERYLADRYSPLEGEDHPAAAPLAVNRPWD